MSKALPIEQIRAQGSGMEACPGRITQVKSTLEEEESIVNPCQGQRVSYCLFFPVYTGLFYPGGTRDSLLEEEDAGRPGGDVKKPTRPRFLISDGQSKAGLCGRERDYLILNKFGSFDSY